MGYKCEVDGKHYEGKPVKVATGTRNVRYENNGKVSTGLETIREVNVHPDNVDKLKVDPIDPDELSIVSFKSEKHKKWESSNKRPQRNRGFSRLSDDNMGNLQTWNEYKFEKGFR
jgi:hypothetical protein